MHKSSSLFQYLAVRTVDLGLHYEILQRRAQDLRDGEGGHGLHLLPGEQVVGPSRLTSARSPFSLSDIRVRYPHRVQTRDLEQKE